MLTKSNQDQIELPFVSFFPSSRKAHSSYSLKSLNHSPQDRDGNNVAPFPKVILWEDDADLLEGYPLVIKHLNKAK